MNVLNNPQKADIIELDKKKINKYIRDTSDSKI